MVSPIQTKSPKRPSPTVGGALILSLFIFVTIVQLRHQRLDFSTAADTLLLLQSSTTTPTSTLSTTTTTTVAATPNSNPYLATCNSSQFKNVTVPLFIKWEEWAQEQEGREKPPIDFFAVQIGGNIGKNVGGGDPIWEYVRPCHWSGVILEPQPAVFAQLQANYADVRDRIQTYNWAASNQSADAMGMCGGGENALLMDRSKYRCARKRRDNDHTNIRVVTLSELWAHAVLPTQTPTVHVLVVDVEGHGVGENWFSGSKFDSHAFRDTESRDRERTFIRCTGDLRAIVAVLGRRSGVRH